MTNFMTKGLRATALAGVLATAAFAAVPAQAVTLSPAAIADLTISAAGSTAAGGTSSGTTFASFTSFWPQTFTGLGEAIVTTASPLSIAYGAGDTFDLVLSNDNENPWDFSVVVNGTYSWSSSIANQTSALASVALDALGGTITSVVVTVSANLPILYNDNGVDKEDRTAEFTVAAVPLPAGLLLIGSGLAALGFVGRRKKTNTDALSAA